MPTQEVTDVTKTLETPVQDFTRGTKFAGRYQIVEKLGTGGMGSVFRVEDTKIHEDVALKLIRPDIAADKKTIGRFSNELKLARKIRHKNVCQMFDLGEVEGTHFITMEYVTGEDLKSFLRRSRQISIPTAISIAKQVCAGLAEAHKLGIVHRDLKPSNIMIDKAGNALIMDFGIARSVKGEALTGENVIIGTPDYMSPEQIEGKEVDQRSDIYSLGVILFEMLTGERLFKGDTSLSVAMKHKSEAPPNPKWLNDQIPDRLSRLVLMCLEKGRERRYQNAEELLSALCTIDAKKAHLAEKEEKKKSVAVLPFEDMSPGKDNEYFSDGLTEEIISDLSGVSALRVISRSSAMTFKGTKKTAPEIAKQLNVQYVLEGSVRKAGNALRITAQLIDATKDAHLWAEKYSGTLDDVFDIQEKVSRSIVKTLRVKLTDKENKQMASRPIENVHAYECHLRAIYQIWLVTEESLEQALKFIDNGLEIIGKNEVLYADKGQVYLHYVDFVVGKDEVYLKKAEKCVKEIFSLNPDSAYGNFLNGLMLRNRGNSQAAVKAFKKAIQVYPDDSNFLTWLGWIYGHSGKCEAARSLVRKILELDPLSPKSHMFEGTIKLFEGKFSSAIKSLYKFHQIEPGNPFYRYWYAIANAYNQNIEEAYKIFALIERDTPNTIWSQLSAFFINALKGKKAEALQSVTKETREMFKKDEMFPIWMAESYTLIHEKEEAFNWLEHGISWGFINYPFLNEYDPFLESIRGEPRFKKLMERVKHEWESFEV
jgi:non-specific serine/threonine protein kinase